MTQVVEVVAVTVGFAFKCDVVVGSSGVASVTHNVYKPLDDIDDVEGQVEQLAHLPGMDHLMVDDFGSHGHVVLGKQNAKQIDGSVAFTEWDYVVAYYLHAFCKVSEIKWNCS